jgi:hypothetical protein
MIVKKAAAGVPTTASKSGEETPKEASNQLSTTYPR